jgi:nucleoside-diphosphate-sugar epimerase
MLFSKIFFRINSNNEEDVAQMWERIQTSYNILMDNKIRKRYDRTEMIVDPGAALRRAAIGATMNGVSSLGKGLFHFGTKAVEAVSSTSKAMSESASSKSSSTNRSSRSSLNATPFSEALAARGGQSSSSKGVSVVTGANGYIGRAVVDVLYKNSLKRNVSGVKEQEMILCLVRRTHIEDETRFWKDYMANECSQETSCCIKVLPYDMLDGGSSITEALETACQFTSEGGEICVYHIASVFRPSSNGVQTAKDNVRGAKDLVTAMGKFPNVRLVLTSSMAAVRGSGQEPENGKFYTHEDWNTISKLDGMNWGSCYQWSKAESERVAWEIAKELNIPMTSMCPSFVFGPPTGALSSSYSITLVGQWVRGESPVQSRLCVDIRDVAAAHVAAGISNEAIGKRFIVSTEARVASEDMAKELAAVCRETKLGDPDAIRFDGEFQGGAIPVGTKEVEATARLKSLLGITLRPVSETISDMGRALLLEREKVTEPASTQ